MTCYPTGAFECPMPLWEVILLIVVAAVILYWFGKYSCREEGLEIEDE